MGQAALAAAGLAMNAGQQQQQGLSQRRGQLQGLAQQPLPGRQAAGAGAPIGGAGQSAPLGTPDLAKILQLVQMFQQQPQAPQFGTGERLQR